MRVPSAKKIAKKYALTDDGAQFLLDVPHRSTDEYMVHGLMLGYLKDVSKVIDLLEKFLPYMDNWAVCDATCANLKIIKKYPNLFENYAKKWLKSENFFIKRFAIVIFLTYFLDEDFDKKHFDLINFCSENYYVKMAQSWYFSVALVKKYDLILSYFEKHLIKDKWVNNKAIQKACESFRISEDKKQYLRKLRCNICKM